MRTGPTRAEAMQLEIFRRMTPAQRVKCACRWTRFSYEIARGAIRGENPDWTDGKIDRKIGKRITGIDVTKLDCGKLEWQPVGQS